MNAFERMKKAASDGLRRFLKAAARAMHELSYLREERNERALRHLLLEARRLLKGVLPKKGGGWVHFGGQDPFQTGQVMQLAAFFYPLYGKRIEVIPEFMEPVLETELEIRGRVYLITPLLCGLRLFLDKDLRRLYRHFAGGAQQRKE